MQKWSPLALLISVAKKIQAYRDFIVFKEICISNCCCKRVKKCLDSLSCALICRIVSMMPGTIMCILWSPQNNPSQLWFLCTCHGLFKKTSLTITLSWSWSQYNVSEIKLKYPESDVVTWFNSKIVTCSFDNNNASYRYGPLSSNLYECGEVSSVKVPVP